MKRIFALLLSVALALTLTVPAVAASYTDIPSGSSLAAEVQKATDYGLMQGYNTTTFGYGNPMTRAQFITVLDRMMGWTAGIGDTRVAMWFIPGAMEVPDTLSETYLSAIEQAQLRDVVDNNVPFRPNDPITRGEMSEMLVRALGLKSAAALAETESNLPFTDVTDRAGYISIAYDIGMTKGTTATTFSPDATATRAQAAAMLVRIYEKLYQDTDFVHAFYAISSYSQLELAGEMDAVSAGWSRMTWDGEEALLATTSANGNEYYVPSGYQEVTDSVEKLHLSVFMDGDALKSMLTSADGRTQAVEQIINELTVSYKTIGKNPYSGVTIDFEGLRSAQRANFTDFLTELKSELDKLGKTLYVCVSPVLTGSYYDGYDYQAISQLANKIILMAYDYDAKNMLEFVGTEYYRTAAQAPIDQVYLSLRAIVKEVEDTSKIVLGFSTKNVAWQIDNNGKLVSGTPAYPTADTVAKRLAQSDTETGWSDAYQQSYAIYTTEDGSRYFLWYQDNNSIQAALNTAKLLGITDISLWRLGNIPTYTIGSESWNWMELLA